MSKRTVDELLHDAARADDGLWFAQSMGAQVAPPVSAEHVRHMAARLRIDRYPGLAEDAERLAELAHVAQRGGRAMTKGTRVQLSELGRYRLRSLPESRMGLHGTVATKGRRHDRVCVIWDGQKTPQYYAAAFIEPLSPSILYGEGD